LSGAGPALAWRRGVFGLLIDVTRNIPAQPFHVMRTVTYSFY
jgi:hypothetical protein